MYLNYVDGMLQIRSYIYDMIWFYFAKESTYFLYVTWIHWFNFGKKIKIIEWNAIL